jgi:hypothetical protein
MEVLKLSEAEPRKDIVCLFLWKLWLEGLGQSESGKYSAEFAQYLQLDRLQAALLIPEDSIETAQKVQAKALEETLRTAMTAEACGDVEVLHECLRMRLYPIIELPQGQIAEHLLADIMTCERIWNRTLPSGEDGLQFLSSIISHISDGSMRGRLLDTFRAFPNGRELLKVVSENISRELVLQPLATRMRSFVDTLPLQTWSASSDDPTLLGRLAEDGGGDGRDNDGVGGEGGKVALVHLTQVSEMAAFMDSQLEYLRNTEEWLLQVFTNLLASACNDVAVDFLRRWCEVCSADSIKDGGLTQNDLPDIAAELVRLSPLRSHAPTWAAVQVASRWCSASGAHLLQLGLGEGLASAS